jgi:ppGpp synthetase/RelA/SpoT-type nucleotidyltranferase
MERSSRQDRRLYHSAKRIGYQSLHVAIDVSEPGKKRPLMEIQIRTKEMLRLAASHYKRVVLQILESKSLA